MIFALALSVAFVSLHGCRDKGIIEEEDMAQIYAEMLMTDQWINNNTGVRKLADTSRVYEPILKKYGHSSETYRKSVEYYLQDPDTYADADKAAQLAKEYQQKKDEIDRLYQAWEALEMEE